MRILTFLIVIVFSYSPAQDLPCADLLEQVKPEIALETIEQRIEATTYAGKQSSDVAIYQVIDRVGERIYQETSLPGVGEIVLRYARGEATMELKDSEMKMPVPAPLLGLLEQTLDSAFEQHGSLPSNYAILSCDGPQQYAGLVAGEQVTVSASVPTLEEDTKGRRHATIHLLFGPEGKLVGNLMTLPELGDTLNVFGESRYDEYGVPLFLEVGMYLLEGDSATLFSETRVETLSYNRGIDPALFGP